eukprot:TRINITY_DN2977_c0_g1_i7.p1 TRINITY_DN2977_c0_g1~~TRINITY_DN2977_c0_g1_i7.p1  ORF type:complete len:478 (+),score=137.80 TRINITY_DN2977_c0_g1_i7:203-1636(+)
MIINTVRSKEEEVKRSLILSSRTNLVSVTCERINDKLQHRSKEDIEELIKRRRLEDIRRRKVDLQRKIEQADYLEKLFVEPKKLSRSFSKREFATAKQQEISRQFLKQWKLQHNKQKQTQQALIEKARKKEKEDEIRLVKQQEAKLKELRARQWEKHMLFKEKRNADKVLLTELSRSNITRKMEEPLYKKYEEKFEQEVQLPLLENYKKRIEAIKERSRPYNREEMDNYMRQHRTIVEQKEVERKEKIKETKRREQKYTNLKKNFESPTLRRVREMDAALKRNRTAQKHYKRELKDKVDDYLSYIRESVQVIPSQAKVAELKERMGKLKHLPKVPKDTRSKYNDLSKIFRNSKSHKSIKKVKNEPLANSSSNSLIRKPVNYLDEFRKAKIKSNSPLHVPLPKICRDWRLDLKDMGLSASQKRELVLNRAKAIDDIVTMDEKLLGASENSDLGYKVSSMLLNSIKAKISVFNEFTCLA